MSETRNCLRCGRRLQFYEMAAICSKCLQEEREHRSRIEEEGELGTGGTEAIVESLDRLRHLLAGIAVELEAIPVLCPSCKAPTRSTRQRCLDCGQVLTKTCKACDYPNFAGWKFCEKCAKPI